MLFLIVTDLSMCSSGFLYHVLSFKNIFVTSGRFLKQGNTILQIIFFSFRRYIYPYQQYIWSYLQLVNTIFRSNSFNYGFSRETNIFTVITYKEYNEQSEAVYKPRLCRADNYIIGNMSVPTVNHRKDLKRKTFFLVAF